MKENVCHGHVYIQLVKQHKLTDNEIFHKNRSAKRCKFIRIIAEIQQSITQSLLKNMPQNFYTNFISIRSTFPAILVTFHSQ